ncbi:MAG TPA: hypothetical protein VGQ76_20185 [Thermoanaerobaculia bacterium]|jgi:hypothetical protein|nr:hypothetical protein [Thermoanaerobaculia bacterium]
MRKVITAFVVIAAVAGCSSTSSSDPKMKKVKLAKPEILFVQTSDIPLAARFADGGLTIHYAMRVQNKAIESITLKRVTVQTVSEGAYHVSPTSKPYSVSIAAAQDEDFDFWVSATPGRSLVGLNGPVTLRVTTEFESSQGTFQHIVMRRVNERTSIMGQQ